jgi:hypothetical protein
VVELIGFIEATFDVVVPDEALFDPDFTSVDGIARIVSGPGSALNMGRPRATPHPGIDAWTACVQA